MGLIEGTLAGANPPRPIDRLRSLLFGQSLVRLFRRLLAVYIFMLVLLPSGSIFGLNVKFLCFFLLLPAGLQMFFSRRRATVARVAFGFAVPGLLLLWLLLSQCYGYEPAYAMAQYKDVMITIISCWLAALLCAEGEGETVSFLRIVVYSEVTASSLKFLLLSYAFARGIPVTQVVEGIKNVFGVSLMTMDFESMLGRIQFISDGLIPICIFAILRYRKELSLRGGAAVTMLLMLLVSDFFSFSRYFWGFGVLAIVLGLLLGRKDVFQLSLIAILSAIVVLSLPILTTVVKLRFSNTVVTSSDQERTAQIGALKGFFASAPILGHGLGSYSHRIIRNDEAPYSYEDQLLALVGQVGILGTALLVLLAVYYFRDIWRIQARGIVQSLGLTVILLAWICAGFFNPEVISSAASVSYAAIAAMASLGLPRGLTHEPGQPD